MKTPADKIAWVDAAIEELWPANTCAQCAEANPEDGSSHVDHFFDRLREPRRHTTALQVVPRPLYVNSWYSGPQVEHPSKVLAHHADQVEKAVLRALGWGIHYSALCVVRHPVQHNDCAIRLCTRIEAR